MKKFFVLLMILGSAVVPIFAQETATPQPTPTTEEIEKAKAEREKNAYRLLDQVVDEAQSLRLAENRVRVQLVAGDLLWDNNQGRARSLFAMAAEGVAELNRAPQNTNNQRGGPQNNNTRRAFSLRQELIFAAARHDAQLAYQLLASTRPPAQPVITDARAPRFQPNAQNPEDSLEQMLLGRIASLDPKLAAQNAEQMMDKGQFPRTMTEVINQLQKQDPEAAAKLADKTVKKLQSANLLTNNEAGFLVQSLLMSGPRPAENASGAAFSTGRTPVLEQGAYIELLGTIVDLALKAAPLNSSTPARRPGQPAVRGTVNVGPNGALQQPTEAQREQNGAHRFLASLQTALPMIDQYLPAKSALVRQKLVEIGMATNPPLNVQFPVLQGQTTADALIQAALTAPPQMQPRLYQQAAFRAIEEGNTDRARQIATEHLQSSARDVVMRRVDFLETAQKVEGARLDEMRQIIARLQTDDEKINMLIEMARASEKANPKLATQLLDDAKQMTSRRATGYDQFGQQLRVARAFATLDPARSFEVLEPGISQINELLSAAQVLNGFEVNMFRDGEMMLQADSALGQMVNRFGQELAVLARSDFDRAETLAGRFQFTEPRIMARLAIVQGLLDVRQSNINLPNRINTVRN